MLVFSLLHLADFSLVLCRFPVAEALAIAPVAEFTTKAQEPNLYSSFASLPLDLYDSISEHLDFRGLTSMISLCKPSAPF